MILKFSWNYKEFRIPKTVLKEKKNVDGLTLFDFKTTSEVTVIKTSTSTSTAILNEQNGVESPEVNPYVYGQ